MGSVGRNNRQNLSILGSSLHLYWILENIILSIMKVYDWNKIMQASCHCYIIRTCTHCWVVMSLIYNWHIIGRK